MQPSNYPALVLSTVSLILSLFTFYWTTLHKRRSFHLIRTSSFWEKAPQFVLANGGKSDLRITNMICTFNHGDGKGGSIPRQTFHFDDGNKDWHLTAGKARHCFVKFEEPFDADFAKLGRFDPTQMSGLYLFEIELFIEWIEMSGRVLQKSVLISEYGFDKSGAHAMGRPRGHVYDMNDSQPPTGLPLWVAQRLGLKKSRQNLSR